MTKPNYERIEDLQWFHSGLNRNTAEALLLSCKTEGTFLLRDCKKSPGHYAVSARCHSSVKHFELHYNKLDDSYKFGIYTFYSFKELFEHFCQQPVLRNDNGDGRPVILRYPYPNNVLEPSEYMDVLSHFEVQDYNEGSTDFHVGSKEGYLIKRGDVVKNWKKRWFVVQRDKLMYSKSKYAKKPQKVWDLNDLIQVVETGNNNRKNTFCLVFTTRTIFCLASTPLEVEEWIAFFQWKIDHFKKLKVHVY